MKWLESEGHLYLPWIGKLHHYRPRAKLSITFLSLRGVRVTSSIYLFTLLHTEGMGWKEGGKKKWERCHHHSSAAIGLDHQKKGGGQCHNLNVVDPAPLWQLEVIVPYSSLLCPRFLILLWWFQKKLRKILPLRGTITLGQGHVLGTNFIAGVNMNNFIQVTFRFGLERPLTTNSIKP